MTLFESRSRIVNGASGVRGVISHLDLREPGGDKSALNKICRRHSGEIKGTSRMTPRAAGLRYGCAAGLLHRSDFRLADALRPPIRAEVNE